MEGNIGAGRKTLLQSLNNLQVVSTTLLLHKIEQSLSMADKIKIKRNHEQVGAFQTLFGKDMMNPLQNYLPKHHKENAFIFQNYVLDIYQQRIKALSAVEPMCKVIVIDRGLDSCQLFTTLNKHHFTDLGLLYLTDKYLDHQDKIHPWKTVCY